MNQHHGVSVALLGASPKTGNMGVSALGAATVDLLAERLGLRRLVVGDHGTGSREFEYRLGKGGTITAEMLGLSSTKRIWSGHSLYWALFATATGLPISRQTRVFGEMEAVLDVTGGDSFTDLYGPKVFWAGLTRKRLALDAGAPLILLPQTYGPFSDAAKPEAAAVVRRAAACWARDERSYGILQDLLGDAFDPKRHRCGVDLAFGLVPRAPQDEAIAAITGMLDSSAGPLVGFNVSGLIYNDPDKAVSRYKFKADYRASVDRFLSGLLEQTDARVLLIPHVVSASMPEDSDPSACDAAAARLAGEFGDRVAVAPTGLDQSELKWLISRTDWFCGTRMHSTIAGLSSGVPTATIAYSDKARGVFESCGQGEAVVDPREIGTEEVVERLHALYQARLAAKESLAEHLPRVKAQVDSQSEQIASQAQPPPRGPRRRDKPNT